MDRVNLQGVVTLWGGVLLTGREHGRASKGLRDAALICAVVCERTSM